MLNKVYFGDKEEIYKGNMHFHTKWSDGRLTADEVVKCYKECGYNFLIWSDHDIYIDTKEFDTKDFITIPGMERGGLNPTWDTNDNPGFHFGCIADPTVEVDKKYKHEQVFEYPQRWGGEHSVTDCINEMKSHGNLVVLNHPEWHMTTFDKVLKEDYFAIEIFNYSTEWSTATSYGTAYLDHALQNGKKVFLVASDDAHGFDRDFSVRDYDGAWIVVNSDKLNSYEIIKNMKKGNYYASTGPEIYDLRVEDGFVKVKCSPCQHIMFKSWPQRSDFLCNRKTKEPIVEATQKIEPYMKYIRVECIDFKGNIAWSNPIFLDERSSE